MLIEAAKLAPRQDHDLALLYEREKQKGNANRATLAVARKMVAYFLPWIDDNGISCLQKMADATRLENQANERKSKLGSQSAQTARSRA